jgi:hypothetical protein
MDLASHLRCKMGEKKHNRVSLARRSMNISWTITVTCPHSSAGKSLYHFIDSSLYSLHCHSTNSEFSEPSGDRMRDIDKGFRLLM